MLWGVSHVLVENDPPFPFQYLLCEKVIKSTTIVCKLVFIIDLKVPRFIFSTFPHTMEFHNSRSDFMVHNFTADCTHAQLFVYLDFLLSSIIIASQSRVVYSPSLAFSLLLFTF